MSHTEFATQTAATYFPSLRFEPDVIEKLGRPGPRYTSYPTADRFDNGFTYANYLEAVAAVRMRGVRSPLSLYLHIPFCESLCYYCACNKVITRDRSKAVVYLDYLKR